MAQRPNVLVIVLDGARADHLSCYGYERETTPFLDQVARDGVRCTQMFTTAPATLAAHAALLTGVHAASHGATEEHPFLAPRLPGMAEQLATAGYRTAAFCTSPWVSPETGCGRGFDAFFTQRYHNRLATRAVSYGRRASDRLLRRSDAGARRSNHAVKRWLTASDEPFFALVHYDEARLPFRLPPPYDRLFIPKGIPAARVRAANQDPLRSLVRQSRLTDDDRAMLAALYDGALRYLDNRVREIAELLQARGRWDDTLCIVTADHGTRLGEHGLLGHKFFLDDGVLRVPLLLRCPARIPAGFVVDELAQTTDVLPTVLDTVGLREAAEALPGRALIRDGRATPGPAFTIAERFRPDLAWLQKCFPDFDPRTLDVRAKAIRTRREKFVWRSDEANELYDLVADPGETRNRIELDAARADALRRQLFDWLAAVEPFEAEGPAAAPDQQTQRRLQGSEA